MARAFTIEQTELADGCHGRVLANIVHRHAEVAGTAINIERACAESDIGSEIVEIVEGDEIHQQAVYIAVVEHEFFELGNIFAGCGIG